MAAFKNNGKLKLLIIVGTRPEIIRLAAVIKKCRKYFDTILAHTGQNYDYNLNGVFFHDLELDDPEVYMNAVGSNLGETMGNIIARSYELMVEIQPDAVLVLGDTNSCLSVIGAKRLHIPIFHMEAGNRCKDECLPEETNRRIVDIISDVNINYAEIIHVLSEIGCYCRSSGFIMYVRSRFKTGIRLRPAEIFNGMDIQRILLCTNAWNCLDNWICLINNIISEVGNAANNSRHSTYCYYDVRCGVGAKTINA